jgi:hypothetical protein
MRSVIYLAFVLLSLCTHSLCADNDTRTSVAPDDKQFPLVARNDEQEQPKVYISPNMAAQLFNMRTKDDSVCYTMHSIYVKRNRDSDVTRYRGQSTCTPANNFHVKPKQ